MPNVREMMKVTERSQKPAICYRAGYHRAMNGYYGYGGYYGPFVGAAPTASQLFATLQQAMTSQDVRSLIKQFNATRQAEGRYGGLSGAQLDPERNPNFPRRLVIWHGINRTREGYPLAPIGVFEENPRGSFESLAFALEDAANKPGADIQYGGRSIYGFGFERVPEPLIIYPR
jgi:hypothetical protein